MFQDYFSKENFERSDITKSVVFFAPIINLLGEYNKLCLTNRPKEPQTNGYKCYNLSDPLCIYNIGLNVKNISSNIV